MRDFELERKLQTAMDDGRPMAIGLDTCVYHEFDLPKILTAYNIQTEEVIYQNRI